VEAGLADLVGRGAGRARLQVVVNQSLVGLQGFGRQLQVRWRKHVSAEGERRGPSSISRRESGPGAWSALPLRDWWRRTFGMCSSQGPGPVGLVGRNGTPAGWQCPSRYCLPKVFFVLVWDLQGPGRVVGQGTEAVSGAVPRAAAPKTVGSGACRRAVFRMDQYRRRPALGTLGGAWRRTERTSSAGGKGPKTPGGPGPSAVAHMAQGRANLPAVRTASASNTTLTFRRSGRNR